MSYRALALGAGPVEIGLIASTFSVLSVMAALPIGRWIDRMGEARFITAAMLLIAGSTSVAIWTDSLLILAMSQATMGLGHIINLVAAQTMVANRGGRQGRDARFGYYTASASMGQLFGPAVAGLLAGGAVAVIIAGPGPVPANAQFPAFLFAVLVALGAAVLSLLLPTGRAPAEGNQPPADRATVTTRGAAGRIIRQPGMPSAMVVSIIVLLSIDLLIAYLPVYGEAHGLSVALVGGLLSVRAAGSLVSRLLLGRFIELLGRKKLLAMSMSIAGAALLLVPVLPHPIVLVSLMLVAGLGLGIGQPITMAWVANRTPHAERATALGLRLTGNQAALLTVPTFIGIIAGATGVGTVFWVLAAALGAGAGMVGRAPIDQDRGAADAIPAGTIAGQ